MGYGVVALAARPAALGSRAPCQRLLPRRVDLRGRRRDDLAAPARRVWWSGSRCWDRGRAARLPHGPCPVRRAFGALDRVHGRPRAQRAAAFRGDCPSRRPARSAGDRGSSSARSGGRPRGRPPLDDDQRASAHREPRLPGLPLELSGDRSRCGGPNARPAGGCDRRDRRPCALPAQPRRHGGNARGRVAGRRVVSPPPRAPARRGPSPAGADSRVTRRCCPWRCLPAGPRGVQAGRYGTLDLSAVGSSPVRITGGAGAPGRPRLTRARSRWARFSSLSFWVSLRRSPARPAGSAARSALVSLLALASLVLVDWRSNARRRRAERSRSDTCSMRLRRWRCSHVPESSARGRCGPGPSSAARLSAGSSPPGQPSRRRDSGNFFAAPAGAFWTRVMDYPPACLGAGSLWLDWPCATRVAADRRCAGRARGGACSCTRRLRPVQAVLTAAAAVCLVGQAIVMSYSLDQELYGTVDVPGGIATGARETFVDAALPSGARAAIVPGALVAGEPGGGAERITFWNAKVDETVALCWDRHSGACAAGFSVIECGRSGQDGVGGAAAGISSRSSRPRSTIRACSSRAGSLTRSPNSRIRVVRGSAASRAVDGPGAPARHRRAAGHAGAAHGQPLGGSARRARHAAGAGGPAAAGRVADDCGWPHRRIGSPARWRGPATRAPATGLPSSACRPWSWQLVATGPGVPASIPVYGPPLPPRPVALWMPAVQLKVAR